jgi:hypothetical protein
MGLLDDAIREHLDLKRRRGADPAEVERAEREALGPVRRAPEERPTDETGDQPPVFAYDRERDEDSWGDDSGEPGPGPDSAQTATVPKDTEEHTDDDPRFFDESEAREPEAAREQEPEPASSHRSADETVEYDVGEARGSEHPGRRDHDDDVLEETPEFLQDTPDHDRLWFEQRPPKDFDFDG